MSYRTIIEPTTGAVTLTPCMIRRAPATLVATGLDGSEECDLYLQAPAQGRANADPLTDREGNAQKLTATDPQAVIDGPGLLLISKDATSSAAGVYIWESP